MLMQAQQACDVLQSLPGHPMQAGTCEHGATPCRTGQHIQLLCIFKQSHWNCSARHRQHSSSMLALSGTVGIGGTICHPATSILQADPHSHYSRWSNHTNITLAAKLEGWHACTTTIRRLALHRSPCFVACTGLGRNGPSAAPSCLRTDMGLESESIVAAHEMLNSCCVHSGSPAHNTLGPIQHQPPALMQYHDRESAEWEGNIQDNACTVPARCSRVRCTCQARAHNNTAPWYGQYLSEIGCV
jgi:hypothetical protein